MEKKSNLEKTTLFATGFYQEVEIVAEYMKKRSDIIESVMIKSDTVHRDQCLKGLWMRAHAWMQSLERLNHTKHIQAIATGNRALLEIAVDINLLHHDKTNLLGWKMYWWGQSERMKSAEQIISFYNQTKIPDEYKAIEEYFNNEKTMIDKMRKTLWPNKKNPAKADHPKRWTGKSDLSRDVEEADSLYGIAIQADLDMTLSEYYKTQYRKINWQIHSGVAGFWNLSAESLNIICGMSLK